MSSEYKYRPVFLYLNNLPQLWRSFKELCLQQIGTKIEQFYDQSISCCSPKRTYILANIYIVFDEYLRSYWSIPSGKNFGARRVLDG
ncbi:hypothetical protein RIR_jg13806.t1 [Rhizophagus irregularis DAOM 181602=DAOM 197198]|nr:hypothetical protein RIR_jg13806.t1 [Rhizophagus irregularis DAOM 181602=DAOM 197198]